jgi:hypothetical protein
MRAEVNRELAAVLATLGPRERSEVLAFARTLQNRNGGEPPSLLPLVGTISSEDLALMQAAIEEECERM